MYRKNKFKFAVCFFVLLFSYVFHINIHAQNNIESLYKVNKAFLKKEIQSPLYLYKIYMDRLLSLFNNNVDSVDYDDIYDFEKTCLNDDVIVSPLYISKYDPRSFGIITSIKNQFSYGICWCLAPMASLETFLIKNNMASNNIDLSEEHLLYWSKRKDDGYGWNKTNKDNGGQAITVTGYFSSWEGPKLEKDIPFSKNKYINKPINYQTAKTFCNVTDIIYISNDLPTIRNAIFKYGSVCSMYCHMPCYLSRDQHSYCYSKHRALNKSSCHEVCVIGWDDNYPHYKFNGEYHPKRNGAWLVKNSWGERFGENGFMWISYEDPNLFNFNGANINYCISNATLPDRRKIMYQLNPYGAVSTTSLKDFNCYNDNKVMTVADVFEFKGYKRVLDSVMFMCDQIGQKYKIYFAPLEDNKPIADLSKMTFIKEGIVEHSGYTTVKVKNIEVPRGKGAIVMTMDNSPNNSPAKIGSEEDICYKTSSGRIVKDFRALGRYNESFIIYDGKSYDAKVLNHNRPLNFTIKVIAKSK